MHEKVVDWKVNAYNPISNKIARNTWRHIRVSKRNRVMVRISLGLGLEVQIV